MSKSRPTRYSAEHKHADYGINSWMNKVGIKNGNLKTRLKSAFLEDNRYTDFDSPHTKTANTFISNRFLLFCNYVNKNRIFFEDNIAQKTLNQQQ